MSIFNTIQKDMYAAMKAGEKDRSGALRNVIAALKDKKIAKREDLTEQEEIKVLKTLTKQHRESIEMYTKGGRTDLADKEKVEMNCLEEYLPAQMGPDDLKKMIKEIIEETGAESMNDIGKVMPHIMKRGAGKIDGKMAQTFVKELLEN